MFKNIGKKIKALAKVLCWISIVIFAIGGIGVCIYIAEYDSVALGIITGVLTIGFGVLLSWLGSFVLYGFGQLVDSTENIEKKLDKKPVEKIVEKIVEVEKTAAPEDKAE